MKYFKRGWYANPKDVDRIIESYNSYYRTIENQLSDNVKQVMKHRHDTHIVEAYMEGKNYVMELDEEIWGKARFIFENANAQINGKIEDEYWLYDEIYKLEDKIEIHILFDQADVIISCDNAHVEVEQKEYLKKIYDKMKSKEKDETTDKFIESIEKSDMSKNEKEHLKSLYLRDDIKPIYPIPNKIYLSEVIENKTGTCGYDLLRKEEKVISQFIYMYTFVKHNKINENAKQLHNKYSIEEKEIYIKIEKDIIKSIETLREYEDIFAIKELNYIIEKLLEIYNKKDISGQEKNQLYIETNEKLQKEIDFGKIYMRILDCIAEGLIK